MTNKITKPNYRFDEKTKKIDVYDLINSKESADYCREIRHEFNTVETAVIIHRCEKLSLAEKCECYNILIEHYEDMEVADRPTSRYYKFVKTLLAKRIEYINKAVEIFEEDEENCIYSADYFYEGEDEDGWYLSCSPYFFSSRDKAKNELEKEMKNMVMEDYVQIVGYAIHKIWVDKCRYIDFKFDRNDNLMDIRHLDSLLREYKYYDMDEIEIHIPKP